MFTYTLLLKDRDFKVHTKTFEIECSEEDLHASLKENLPVFDGYDKPIFDYTIEELVSSNRLESLFNGISYNERYTFYLVKNYVEIEMKETKTRFFKGTLQEFDMEVNFKSVIHSHFCLVYPDNEQCEGKLISKLDDGGYLASLSSGKTFHLHPQSELSIMYSLL